MPRPDLFSATAVSLLLVCGPAFAAAVIFERDTPVRAEPRLGAPVRAHVPEGTDGQAGVRRGPWLAVRTSAGSGWVPSFNVRYAPTGRTLSNAAPAPSVVNGVRSITGLNVTSTMGIRGLDKDDREHARFDARQLSLLEQSRATKAQARAAAAAAGLKRRDVDFLEER